MNALSEKMKDAGVDTLGARLTTVCVEAVRQYPGSIAEAWRFVGAAFGHEFIRGLMNDMQRNTPAPAQEPKSPPTPLSKGNHSMASPAPYKPRVIPAERLEKRRQLQQIVKSKYKNSGDVPWSDVGCHEALGLMRDGREVEALLAACPSDLPNDGRTFGDVLGAKRVDEIIAQVRSMK